MSFDYSKLLGRMRERGYTQETLAAAIGLSECSINLKLNNRRYFKQDEIMLIAAALRLGPGEIPEYFFAGR